MSTSKETIDNPDGGLDIILFILGNFEQNNIFPFEILQNCVTPIGNSMAKNQDNWKLKNVWKYYFKGIKKKPSVVLLK